MTPIPYDEFVESYRGLSKDAFLRRVDCPVLLLPPFALNAADPADTPFLTNTFSPEVLSGSHAAGRLMLAPVRKREASNAFGSMVTLGRAANNDLVITNSNVSKFHAYVRQIGESWTLSDANSRNGTQLDGKRLPAERPFPLRTGSQICLATLVTLEFLLPDDLYQRVQEGKLCPQFAYEPSYAQPGEETETVAIRR